MVYSVLYVKTPIFIGPPSRRLMLLSGCLHLRFCFLQPVRHPHLAVHRRRGGEMLLRLLALARAPVELAEAEVAVRDEGAHAARLGECQGIAVVGLAAVGVETVRMGHDVAGEVRCIGGESGVTRRGPDRAATQALGLVEPTKNQTGPAEPSPTSVADETPRRGTLEEMLSFPKPVQRLTRFAELGQYPGRG